MRVTCLAGILKLTYKLVQPGLRLSLKKARYFFNSDSKIYLQIHAAGPEFVTKIRALLVWQGYELIYKCLEMSFSIGIFLT